MLFNGDDIQYFKYKVLVRDRVIVLPSSNLELL